jgi:uncharacterized phage-associated protein
MPTEERSMKVNQDKFRELVLYLSEKSKDDPKFGATKLNKLLYFCDFLAYVKFGHPITGASYLRLENGPAPKCLVPVRREMSEQGILEVKDVRLANGKTQVRTFNLRAPSLSQFRLEEIQHVDAVLEALKDLDAEDVSALSHLDVGWIVMRQKETIPYDLAFYSNEPLTKEEIERGREIAATRKAA